jgi:hypothetical protein
MTTPAALTPGFRRLGDHVIERRSRDLGNRGYVVEERDQSDAHRTLVASTILPSCQPDKAHDWRPMSAIGSMAPPPMR